MRLLGAPNKAITARRDGPEIPDSSLPHRRPERQSPVFLGDLILNRGIAERPHVKIDKFPWWLVSAVLYGLSWPMPWNVNLSFLAWFALVFLFVSLEKTRGIWPFLGITWGFTFIAYTICSGWFLEIPTNRFLIAVGTVTESFCFPLPFIPFYFIKRRVGFQKSIFILPFLFVIGEWIYCSLEHNLSFLLVAHSQTANLWLIQYADVFGFLSITFWVVLFNVLMYSTLARSGFRLFSSSFLRRAVPSIAVLISLPLIYAAVRNDRIRRLSTDRMKVTMINTRFAPNLKTDEQLVKKLDRIVELTDSVDYCSRQRGERSDVIVWHEGAIPNGNKRDILDFVQTAVNDWGTPLLSGVEHFERFGGTGFGQPVNRVVLFTPHPGSSDSVQFYDKVNLAPGWESIPYLSLFHLAGIRFGNEYKFHKKGDRIRLFDIPGQTRRFTIGTPIYFEQNAPSVWNRMVRLGAEGFIQVSFESWFGKTYFQKQVAYITRLRAIETRHAVARCSNGGLTFFVDPFGRIHSPAPGPESSTTDSIALSEATTYYTRHQNHFPLFCLMLSIGYPVLLITSRKPAASRK
jgi:apolipoprotein N-acyltransferase